MSSGLMLVCESPQRLHLLCDPSVRDWVVSLLVTEDHVVRILTY